ncbi:uncharacterized protein LOC129264306 [Lytechinus pictus]|uniref:uncharacterized protein LOC129264306 n=1 Tax=Lytechinus pictus TaxID=7653 RepID=UPI0030B9E8CC
MSRHSDMVIPVLEKSGKYEVLGGMSYINASKELVDDERYGHLSRGWRCRVYHNLNRIEALRVASLFRIGQPVEEGLSLQEEVAICRSILYSDHGLEVDAHPPKMTAPTRKHCAVALGRSDAKNSLRALEPTFQLASYSSRCYEKVTELFNLVQETTGRNLKQFCFMKLQGLAEEEKYRLLIQACTSLNVKGMMKEAEACKAKKYLQNFFTKGVGTLTWAEAMAKHPAHTTEEAMKPYIGLKWKKGMIPEAFLDHINSAKRSLDRDRPTDSIPALAIHEINTDRPGTNAPNARTVIHLATDIKSLNGIVNSSNDVHMVHIIVSEPEDLQEINHHVAVMYAAVESRMRGPNLLCMRKKEDIFEHAIRYYTCRDEYVVDVGDGVLATVALSCGRRTCTPDAFDTPDTLVDDTPATIDPSEVEWMLDEPSHISDSELIEFDSV